MKIWLLAIVGFLGLVTQLTSQSSKPTLSLKLDLSAPLWQSYGGALQLNMPSKNRVELYLGYGTFPIAEKDVFHGDLIVHYAERRIDTLKHSTGKPIAFGHSQLIGSGKPLPSYPAFLAHSFFQTRLGYRFVFAKQKSRWAVFAQPGISALYARYYKISETLKLDDDHRVSEVYGQYPYQYRVTVRTAHYRQTRSMRMQNIWLVGLNYDVGATRKLGKHFFLEGRVTTGANLMLPYETPRPPVPMRRFWVRPTLLAGWTF